ncbi:hypothetical protein SLS58_007118 [Diplodia intermedia]|uniref:RING-type E3 ubiquitin transferase n=1 Tax=Diplodia intermedia TaxID=856260 RepID=A0ABR3TLA5_9PEZI
MSATVLMRYVRATCAAAVVLQHAVTAQTVTPSNATDQPADTSQLVLSVARRTVEGVPVAQVVPLTARAADDLDVSDGLPGQLFYASDSSAQRLNSSNIAYIDCDPDAYRGFSQASDVLHTAIDHGAAAALFFSKSARSCNVTGVADSFPFLYSMVNATASQQLLDDLIATTSQAGQVYFVTIRSTAGSSTNGNDTMSTNGDSGSDQSQSNSNPLGPSPSTAVAMIILYSITGVITALFLVIIITGALRAHRHPERYGPGVVLNGGRGGARQTRVRGIARAMLDTLPVVKFGDNNQQNPPKPADVEMGDTTARNSAENMQQAADADAHGQQQAGAAGATGGAETAAANGRISHEGAPRSAAAEATNGTEQQADSTEAGIAPAAAGGSAENLASEGDAYTGCTICTEEFEPGQDVRLLPCNHKFHPECIDPWLLNVSGTCPLCMFRDLLHLRGHDANSTSEERLAMARRMAIDRNSRDANQVATPRGEAAADDRRRSRRLSSLFRPGRHGGAAPAAAATDVEEAALPQPPPPVHDGGAAASR